MQVTSDKIADMLTRIRNAIQAEHETVDIPLSKLKLQIAEVLKDEGYVKDFEVVAGDKYDSIRIELKYINDHSAITGLKRISRPGLRIYSSVADLPYVLDGLGIAIVSTSVGIMTDKACREQNVGGEVLAYVW